MEHLAQTTCRFFPQKARRAQGRRLHVQGEPREGGYMYKESPGKEATSTWPCFQFVSKHKLALNFV